MRVYAIAIVVLATAARTDAFTMKAGTPSSPSTSTATQQRHRRTISHSTRKDALLQGSFGALALGFAASGLVMPSPRRAEAFPFGGDDEVTGALDEVARARQKVEEVLSGLKSKQLKGGKEDSATIIRYMDAHYKPLQAKMLDLAPKLKLADGEKQKRAELLPLLLKGHLAELTAAARTGVANEQLQEMEEVAESVDEFLALAKEGGKVVKSYLGPAPEFDITREYGPFACEFWGKVRLPESNICVWPDELEAKK
jgi:hypothetical protein